MEEGEATSSTEATSAELQAIIDSAVRSALPELTAAIGSRVTAAIQAQQENSAPQPSPVISRAHVDSEHQHLIEEDHLKPMRLYRCFKFKVWIILMVILVILLIRNVLILFRYAIPSIGCDVPPVYNFEVLLEPVLKNTTIITKHKQIITAMLYAILSLLQFLKYCYLGRGIYRFYGTILLDMPACTKEELKIVLSQVKRNYVTYLGCTIIIVIMLPLALASPIIGVIMERNYEKNNNCAIHLDFLVFIVYCVVNVVPSILEIVTLISLLFATLSVQAIWSTLPELEQDQAGREARNRAENIHDKLSEDYDRRGSITKQIIGIYESWFLIPWISYIMIASIDTSNILRPWKSGSEETPSVLPAVYYLLFNINHIIQIFIAFILARLMGYYEHRQYIKMRIFQLNDARTYDNGSALAYARTLLIEEDERYIFKARFFNVRVAISSPFLAVQLIVGLFISVSGSLQLL